MAQRRVQQAEQELSDLQEEYDKLLKKQDSSKPNGEIAYQTLYPELMLDPLTGYTQEQKVYLTFDDGPSERTIEILDVLKQRDIKATFFVVGSNLNSEQGQKNPAPYGRRGPHHRHPHRQPPVPQHLHLGGGHISTTSKRCMTRSMKLQGSSPRFSSFPGGSVNGYNGDHLSGADCRDDAARLFLL